jgi:hypothetical protein
MQVVAYPIRTTLRYTALVPCIPVRAPSRFHHFLPASLRPLYYYYGNWFVFSGCIIGSWVICLHDFQDAPTNCRYFKMYSCNESPFKAVLEISREYSRKATKTFDPRWFPESFDLHPWPPGLESNLCRTPVTRSSPCHPRPHRSSAPRRRPLMMSSNKRTYSMDSYRIPVF